MPDNLPGPHNLTKKNRNFIENRYLGDSDYQSIYFRHVSGNGNIIIQMRDIKPVLDLDKERYFIEIWDYAVGHDLVFSSYGTKKESPV